MKIFEFVFHTMPQSYLNFSLAVFFNRITEKFSLGRTPNVLIRIRSLNFAPMAPVACWKGILFFRQGTFDHNFKYY